MLCLDEPVDIPPCSMNSRPFQETTQSLPFPKQIWQVTLNRSNLWVRGRTRSSQNNSEGIISWIEAPCVCSLSRGLKRLYPSRQNIIFATVSGPRASALAKANTHCKFPHTKCHRLPFVVTSWVRWRCSRLRQWPYCVEAWRTFYRWF